MLLENSRVSKDVGVITGADGVFWGWSKTPQNGAMESDACTVPPCAFFALDSFCKIR